MSLVKFKDGYKISTLSIKPEESGQGLSKKFCDYLLEKYKTIYSGDSQTGAARGL